MRPGFAILATAVVSALALTPTAAEAKPVHGRHMESFTDRNFCGTGSLVRVNFKSAFSATERDGSIKTQHQGRFTFRHGDSSVIVMFAGQFTDTIVAQEGDAQVHQLVSKGVTEKIKLPHGPVLSIDAGLIVERVTVVDGNVVDVQIVRMAGPHPEAVSGGSLFCEVVPGALGIG